MVEACVARVRTSRDNQLERGERQKQKRGPNGKWTSNHVGSFGLYKDRGFDSVK